MKRPRIQVSLKTFQRKWRLNRPALTRFIERTWICLNRAGVVAGSAVDTEVGAVFLNNRQIQWYNARFREKKYPTDVLSFPVNEVTAEGRHYLGDLLISVEKAAAQAEEKRHSPDLEMQILILHGMIHLIGFDHETDSGEMDRLERRLRKQVLAGRRLVSRRSLR